MTTFRDRIERAVENREPLDTPEFRRLAATATEHERADFRDQVALDHAIVAWRGAVRETQIRVAVRRRVAAFVAAAAAGAGFAWIAVSGPATHDATGIDVAQTSPVAVIAPENAARSAVVVRDPLVASRPSSPQTQFAEASLTAERLAYAFEPVGEQVGTVLRFLVDSVPGADVFSM